MLKKLSKSMSVFLAVLIVLSVLCTQAYAADSWTTKGNVPSARHSQSTIAMNDKIYMICGFNGSSNLTEVQEYSPVTEAWTVKASASVARHAFGAAELNGKIYIAGGNSNSDVTNSFEEYDTTANTWTVKANMNYAKNCLGLVSANGKIYAIGGNPNGPNTVEEYNPSTNTWAAKANMPTARYALSVVTLNNKIYAIGGFPGSEPTSIVEEYDPLTNTWTTKASMPTARAYAAATVINNKIYVMGGKNSTDYYNTVEEYDLATNTWSTKASMSTQRAYFSAAAANGKIYTFAGLNSSGFLSSIEEYTPPVAIPSSPTNLIATAGNAQVSLSWTASTGATGYNVKRSTTAGGSYTTVASNISTASYVDTNVLNDVTYYYVVSALNTSGESDNSNEVSVTPQQPGGNRALLVITMTNGTEKEYDLSMAEVNAFIQWYDNRANGTGSSYFVINKTYNVGPFLNRKDYIVFDKILCFEVMDYTSN